MKRTLLLAAVFAVLSFAAWSAPRTVVLSVPDMTCSACPLTVRAALSKIAGVSDVQASYETKEAVVTFDDSKTTVEALSEATANAGYPSTVKR